MNFDFFAGSKYLLHCIALESCLLSRKKFDTFNWFATVSVIGLTLILVIPSDSLLRDTLKLRLIHGHLMRKKKKYNSIWSDKRRLVSCKLHRHQQFVFFISHNYERTVPTKLRVNDWRTQLTKLWCKTFLLFSSCESPQNSIFHWSRSVWLHTFLMATEERARLGQRQQLSSTSLIDSSIKLFHESSIMFSNPINNQRRNNLNSQSNETNSLINEIAKVKQTKREEKRKNPQWSWTKISWLENIFQPERDFWRVESSCVVSSSSCLIIKLKIADRFHDTILDIFREVDSGEGNERKGNN